MQHRRIVSLAEATGLSAHSPNPKQTSTVWRAIIVSAWTALLLGSLFLIYKAVLSDAGQAQAGKRVVPVSELTQGVQAVAYPLAHVQKMASVLDPEAMAHGPITSPTGYNASFKSPCWVAGDGKFHCLPQLILMGGFHSGAGYLAKGVSKHPDVATDQSSNDQYWAEDTKTMANYLEGWRSATQRARTQPESVVIFDHSPSTFAYYWAAGGKAHRMFGNTMRPCWNNCTSHAQGNADACMTATCFPKAQSLDKMISKILKVDYVQDQILPAVMRGVYGERIPNLVALVRNPIDRLHSAYYGYPHYHSKYGDNPEGFLAYVKEQVAAFRNCSAKHGEAACVLLFESLGMEEEKVFFHCDQLLRGTYSVYVEGWLRFFPRKNVLIIKSEDLFADGPGTLQKVFAHAGLKAMEAAATAEALAAYTIPRHVKGRQMLPEARKILTEFYTPFNKKLAAMLGDKSYLAWNQPPAKVEVHRARAMMA